VGACLVTVISGEIAITVEGRLCMVGDRISREI
jgi:hypothetical protein